MKKYIDYNSLEQEAYEIVCHARQQVDLIIANTIKSIIDKQPDALVRCKDCKYWKDQNATSKWLPCIEMKTDKNWYCADGERQ